LLIAGGDTMAMVGQELGAPQAVRTFPGDTPTDLAPSPNGQQVAFGLGDRDRLQNHVYVMNIDGSGLRQLTTSVVNEDGASWSPDGNWIVVRHAIGYAFGSGDCPSLWVVPASGVSVALSEGTAARKLQWVRYDGEIRGVCALSTPVWRASQTALPATPGTPLEGPGLNAGLSGRLFYSQPGTFAYLDLASGIAAALPTVDVYDSWPSFDGNEIAYAEEVSDRDAVDIEQITIATLDGNKVASFEHSPRSRGPLKLSPDGQLLATAERDDDAFLPKLTTLRRDGTVVGRGDGVSSWAWLPNGNLLWAVQNKLCESDPAFVSSRPITTLLDAIHDLDVSRDGQQYVFSMVGHIWLLNADGTGLRQLTDSSGAESAPTFAPDGRSVAVKLERAQAFALWAMRSLGMANASFFTPSSNRRAEN
jgi:Tol biopolymer transport system component